MDAARQPGSQLSGPVAQAPAVGIAVEEGPIEVGDVLGIGGVAIEVFGAGEKLARHHPEGFLRIDAKPVRAGDLSLPIGKATGIGGTPQDALIIMSDQHIDIGRQNGGSNRQAYLVGQAAFSGSAAVIGSSREIIRPPIDKIIQGIDRRSADIDNRRVIPARWPIVNAVTPQGRIGIGIPS